MTAALIALLKRTWKPLALTMLVALSLWGYGQWRFIAGQDATNLVWSDKWSKRDAKDANARAASEARERTEEQRRQKAADEERERAKKELARVKADVDAAERAGDSLQRQLAVIQAKFGRSETGRISALAAASAAKSETARVLAQLLSESDKRAGVYAKEADERYEAGSSCERTYNKVTNQPASQ